jgi:hypothetical protein
VEHWDVSGRAIPCGARSFGEATPELISFQGLKSLLDGLSRECTEGTVSRNLALMNILGRTDRIVSLLQLLLADERLLVEIASRSYRHTNHFDKIVLIDSDDRLGYRLTLHLWTPPYSDADATDEQIHDHRFCFWSRILTGTLISQNYVRSDTGNVYNEYQYIPEKHLISTVGNFYRYLGPARLYEMEGSRISAGTSYHLSYEHIHRIVLPRKDTTCTLVLRGPRKRNHASVFSNSRRYEPLSHTMFSADELTSKISMLAAVIPKARQRTWR